MKEILFRGKRLDNGEWVEGYYIRRADNTHFIVTMQPNEYGKVEYPVIQVDPNTVCQYVGITDCNETKIFEGDVVAFIAFDALGNERGQEQGVVRFESCSYQIGRYDMWDILLNDDEAEVIGNIHDNPRII